MKTQRFWSVGLTLACTLSGLHLSTAGEAPKPAATQHMLWKVEGKTNVVYLLGSVHFLKPEHYPLAAPIESAFQSAKVVAFETDVEKLELMDTQLKLMAKATLPEGETLRDHLSPALYATFSKYVTDAGLPAGMFDQFRPSVAGIMLEVLELQKIGLNPEYGVDKHFYKRARSDGKELVALETVDFQISLLTEFPKSEGDFLMKATLTELDQVRKTYNDMLAAWQTGDAARLDKMLNSTLGQSPAIYKRLVTDRNRAWLPKIEEMLRSGKNGIVIVGAGHLVGSEGVVELLKKKGLKVTQL